MIRSGSDHCRYRDACVNFIFLDWRAAASRDVETRLWNDHGLVNSKFRPYLASFREGDGKKKHVERRKAEKLYLDFIKSSMRFYRGFIQRLASHFKNVPEVFEIARKFSLDSKLHTACLYFTDDYQPSLQTRQSQSTLR